MEPLGTYEWAHAIGQKTMDLWIEHPFDDKKLLRIELKNIAIKDKIFKFDKTRFKNLWEYMETEEFKDSYLGKFSAQIVINQKKGFTIPCKVEIKPYQKVTNGHVLIAQSNVVKLKNLCEWWKKPEIRQLSGQEILTTLTQMQPVINKKGKYFSIAMGKILKNPTSVGFTWKPRPTTEKSGLKVLKVITTHHSDPMPQMFRPDVVEVLNQIPEEDFKHCCAFMTDPETAKQGGRYDFIAQTTLFTF